MNVFVRAAVLSSVLALAGCAGTSTMTPGPIVGQNTTTVIQPQTLTPAQTTAVARAMTDVSPYVEAAALAQMSAGDKSKAADAQFNALQFGRPGAPRPWSGDGANGNVTVGPFVRVNNLDCRDFTHAVNVGGQTLARKGTACRENGLWTVVSAGAV